MRVGFEVSQAECNPPINILVVQLVLVHVPFFLLLGFAFFLLFFCIFFAFCLLFVLFFFVFFCFFPVFVFFCFLPSKKQKKAKQKQNKSKKKAKKSKQKQIQKQQKSKKEANPKSKKKGNFQFLPSSFSPALFVSERFPYSHVRLLRFPFSFSLSSLGPQDFLPAACPDSSILVFISVRLVVFFFFLLFVFPCI